VARAGRLSKADLFENYAANDTATITYTMRFWFWRQPHNGSGGQPAPPPVQAQAPGKFLVGARGATLATLTEVGRYRGALVAEDGRRQLAHVLEWVFAVARGKAGAIKKLKERNG